MRAVSILREAAAVSRAQPVATLLTVLMIAGMALAVLMTSGRTIGAEERVLSTLDAAGTRLIVVKADESAGLDTAILTRISGISGIEWAGAFSTATDATNARFPGAKVAVRSLYTFDGQRLDVPEGSAPGESPVFLSPAAMDVLGIPDAAGAIELENGVTYGVGGIIHTPDFLADYEPLALIPTDVRAGTAPIGMLIVIAHDASLVAPLSETVLSLLQPSNPDGVKVQTSENLAELRGMVQGQLGEHSRGLVLALLGLSSALNAVLLLGLVLMRRKEFGRRRALGATKGFIVQLLLDQTALAATAGFTLGIAVGLTTLGISGDPAPPGEFILAFAILTLAAALISALIPAVYASRREPITELRTA